MANNFIQVGDVLTIPAAGAVTSGAGVLSGSLFGVAQNTVTAASEPLSIGVTGIYQLAKVGSQAWTVGAKVYWDADEDHCTTVASGNTLIGVAAEAVGSGAGETLGKVRLNGAAV